MREGCAWRRCGQQYADSVANIVMAFERGMKGMSHTLDARWSADYEDIKNFIKKPCQNGPKSDPKIDVWVIRGPIFEVLGRFLRSLIFDEFSIDKKFA